MRALLVLALSSLLLWSCANDEPLQPPTTRRACGELEGVAPAEPVVLGNDGAGCPVFAAVPCTRAASEYGAICGSDCTPSFAIKADGDVWLVGCETRGPGVGCSGPDYNWELCGVDPFRGEVYWRFRSECSPTFVYFWDCWESCDGSRTPTEEACL